MYMTDVDDKYTERGILLFSNRKYLFALGAFLVNLKEYVSYDGVIVYHDGFTLEEQLAIQKIEPRIRFIKYGIEEFVREFNLNKEEIELCPFIKAYTVLAVVKFKILQHLDEYSTMMFFDVDMILTDCIDDLVDGDFDIAYRTGELTIKEGLKALGFNDELFRELGVYDFYDKTLIPNGGFIILKRTFDYRNVYEQVAKFLSNISFHHPFYIDEILIAYIKEYANLNVKYLDGNVYNAWPNQVSSKSKLVHFMGNFKPWNRQMVQMIFREWKNNYDQYTAITGLMSKEVVDFYNISRVLLQEFCLEKWNALFYEHGFVYPRALKLKPQLTEFTLVFSYFGIVTYKIELEYWTSLCHCICWFNKNNKNISISTLRKQLHDLVAIDENFIGYSEDQDGVGVKTVGVDISSIPEFFYRLYDMTVGFRRIQMTRFVEIRTYHGTKLYVNEESGNIINANNGQGAEVYAGVNGDKISLFISKTNINVYISKIGKDGTVFLSGEQIYFSCIYNQDQSISIDIDDGSLLSADINGNVTLRHWNREWEHFRLQTIGMVME